MKTITFNNMILRRLFAPVLLLMLQLVSAPAHAYDEDLCAPFKNSQIDQGLLAMMLKAAKDGELYRIKPDSSRMGFCVNSPLGPVEAQFRDFQGGLALKENGQPDASAIKQNDQQGRVLVRIAVDSLEANSGIIGSMLKGESFFDSEHYPEILFVSTGFEWISDEKAVFKGNLTMRGVTKQVAFYVDMQKVKTLQGEEVLTVKASTTIQRSEFNMYTLSPMVGDRVTLCMTIDAYKYKT